MKEILNYIPGEYLQFVLGFLVGYITRLFVGRFKGVRYSIKNLFRLFH